MNPFTGAIRLCARDVLTVDGVSDLRVPLPLPSKAGIRPPSPHSSRTSVCCIYVFVRVSVYVHVCVYV